MVQQIAELTKELRVRETAAKHLSGIPAKQNENRINKLYDLLTDLHIKQLEQLHLEHLEKEGV